MNRWDALIRSPRAAELRSLLCQAAKTAHVENGERFAPDDLGDDARIYGIATSNTARFLAGRAIEQAQLDGVVVREHGLVWWLEIDRTPDAPVRVYFYKAPPGARSVWDLRLDDADVKRNLSASNGRQLELFSRLGRPGHADLQNVIVVHYGDPHTGPDRLDVGAPYINDGELAWDWHERFDLDDIGEQPTPARLGSGDPGGFEGLRLIEPAAGEQEQDAVPGGAAQEATVTGEHGKFEELGLRPVQKEGERRGQPGEAPR